MHTNVRCGINDIHMNSKDGMGAGRDGVEVGGADGALLVRASAKKEMGMRMYKPMQHRVRLTRRFGQSLGERLREVWINWQRTPDRLRSRELGA